MDEKVNRIIKVWRGYSVRNQIKLAGPGALSRKRCNNEDELISLDSIAKINPFDYFGFEEAGMIYGFDVRTILTILNENAVPLNPYTRQPFSIETRKRLRSLFGYRLRHKLPIYHENAIPKSMNKVLTNRWVQLCQIIEENGFFDINPNLFLGMNRTQLYIFLSMILNDMKTWSAEHKTTPSRRFKYCFWIQNVLNKYQHCQGLNEYSFFVSSILLSILYDSVEPYTVCFIIMSALYRL